MATDASLRTGYNKAYIDALEASLPATFVAHLAAPTGVAATDVAAIEAAIEALPAAGGKIIMQPGDHDWTGGVTFDKLVHLEGSGAGNSGTGGPTDVAAETGVTRIVSTSTSGSVITVEVSGSTLSGFALISDELSTPTASVGITVTGGNNTRFIDVDVQGFYTLIDIQHGSGWRMRGCTLSRMAGYGVKIANSYNPDLGDWTIADTIILGGTYASTAGIFVGSGGGGKISNTKLNSVATNSGAPDEFQYGIELAPGTDVITMQLMVVNSSIENYSVHGFYAHPTDNALWRHIMFTGVQFGGYLASQEAVMVAPEHSGQLPQMTFTGCSFNGQSGYDAMSIDSVTNSLVIDGCSTSGFRKLVTYTNCPSVKDNSSQKYASYMTSSGSSPAVATTTSFKNVGTHVFIECNVGDVLILEMFGTAYSAASTTYTFGFAVGPDASRVDVPGTLEWRSSGSNQQVTIAHKTRYVVQAGDIENGKTTVQLRAKAASGEYRILTTPTGTRYGLIVQNLGVFSYM